MRSGLTILVLALIAHACFVSVEDFPVGTGVIGEACDADNLCAPEFECWAQGDDPGPPGGMCTVRCASDNDCTDDAQCVEGPDATSRCFLRCQWLEAEANKCNGREQLACRVAPDLAEVCVPTCISDGECGARSTYQMKTNG